ncbi:MAG: pseudouridine synthase [Ruminococcaceae bacterium]|nr:pseudouridine synthase [Oscillospiraceae bacterium]
MRYYMFNKPRGCITACSDERHKTVMDYFDGEERKGLFPVGRLDKDTEGFLIITDDGQLSYHVTTPEREVEKTYFFYAKGQLDGEKIKKLEGGVDIMTSEVHKTAPAKAEKVGETILRNIADKLDCDPARLKHTRHGDVPVTAVKITITEGKKHQVKKMAMAVGMRIVYLERIAIAGVPLDTSLGRGEYRPLTEEEIALIRGAEK